MLATSRLLRLSGADGMKITSYQMLGSVPIEGSGGGWYYPFTSLLLGKYQTFDQHLPESPSFRKTILDASLEAVAKPILAFLKRRETRDSS